MTAPIKIEAWQGDSPTLATVKKIYMESFPVEEQRPWADLVNRAADGRELRLLTIRAGEALAGFITAWDLGAFLYIEHFATAPAMRGGGLGARTLAAVTQDAGKPVVVEVERPEAGDDARRRIGFYQRCGFSALEGYDYMQPPYTEGQPPVPLLLMSTEPAPEPAMVAATLHRRIYGAEP